MATDMALELILAGQEASITFQDFELPERLPWGGEQLISLHQYVGGQRTLDALGPSDEPISWSGIFLTSAAVYRARFCDTLRRTGEQCTLSWGEFSYTGIVSHFRADFTRGGLYVPYSITFTVAEDDTAYVLTAPTPPPEAMITADMRRASALQNCIGDSTLTSLMTSVDSAVNAVTSAMKPLANGLTAIVSSATDTAACAIAMLNQTTAAIVGAVAPIAAAQARAQLLITSAEQAITGITTLGGFLPGNPVAKMTGNFIQQTNAAIQLPPLYEFNALMGRTQANLNVISAQGPTAKTITVGGGTLQAVAAKQYGDSTLWPVLAQANGLSDPNLSGIKTLIIPPRP